MDKTLRCCQCDRLIGGIIIRNGTTALLISLAEGYVVVVYRFHAWCECGRQIHWESGKAKNRKVNINQLNN